MRKTKFVNNEFYHVYNRGVDKRQITLDQDDSNRFIQSLKDFNSLEPIGSIYEHSFEKNQSSNNKSEKLVNIICYCLNPNHYHLILEQLTDDGIEKLLHRLGMGYSKYFNNKYKRNGILWQGKFKDIHIEDNEYLLHLSAYVNLNDKAHQLGHLVSKLVRNSWNEYLGPEKYDLCQPSIVLDQFDNKENYQSFALSALESIKSRKSEIKMDEMYLE